MRFLFGLAPLLLITAGNCSNGDFGAPLRSTRNDSAAGKALVSFRFCIDHFPSYAYGLGNFQYDCKLPATHVISSGAACRYEDKGLALY